ncbi:hypothetical protein H6P81_012065 [Aristolochia fimbriata]|uniref:Uncharacterized protein n=1 Tax=Aristolochia fimbriata TaxID=158543 RepID=A0AAV7EE01_ARIFI|nr:hypothetical protein H6P81_012065 [Aristolochia fimbriata]
MLLVGSNFTETGKGGRFLRLLNKVVEFLVHQIKDLFKARMERFHCIQPALEVQSCGGPSSSPKPVLLFAVVLTQTEPELSLLFYSNEEPSLLWGSSVLPGGAHITCSTFLKPYAHSTLN